MLNGHDHDYERFAPQTVDGAADPPTASASSSSGPAARRCAGSGGSPRTASARSAAAHGVLKLTLGAGGYTWAFVPVPGKTYADAGSAACH